MKSLLEHVMSMDVHQAKKHGLSRHDETPEDYAQRQINAMDNVHLVEAIESALQDWLRERGVSL